MKNKTVKMILAVAALLLCSGAYVGVKTCVSRQEGQQSQEDEKDAVSVFQASQNDIKTVSFLIDGSEVTFEKTDDKWVKQEEEEFPVDQTVLDEAVSSLSDVESDRVLEKAENLEQYGLDKPVNTLKISTDGASSEAEEGTDEKASGAEEAAPGETILRIGDKNESTGQYYVSKNEDRNTVYLVKSEVVEPFMKGLYDYAEKEDFPVITDGSKITKVSVSRETSGDSYVLEKDADAGIWNITGTGENEIEHESETGMEMESKTANTGTFFSEKADSAAANTLAGAFGSMSYEAFVDYNCEDKSQYGLNKPYAVITAEYQEEAVSEEEETTADSESDSISDENFSDKDDSDLKNESLSGEEALGKDGSALGDDSASGENILNKDDPELSEENTEPEMVDQTLTIAVGDETADGSRYVCVNDSSRIYTMSADTLSTFLDKKVEDFWDMTVNALSVNNLESLDVEYKGVKHTVNVSRETSKNEDGEEEQTETYLLDGTSADETKFMTFYNKLINMTAQRRLTEEYEPAQPAEMKAVFRDVNGNEIAEEFYAYDANYYAVVVGEKVYLVNKMEVKALFKAYENLTD